MKIQPHYIVLCLSLLLAIHSHAASSGDFKSSNKYIELSVHQSGKAVGTLFFTDDGKTTMPTSQGGTIKLTKPFSYQWLMIPPGATGFQFLSKNHSQPINNEWILFEKVLPGDRTGTSGEHIYVSIRHGIKGKKIEQQPDITRKYKEEHDKGATAIRRYYSTKPSGQWCFMGKWQRHHKTWESMYFLSGTINNHHLINNTNKRISWDINTLSMLGSKLSKNRNLNPPTITPNTPLKLRDTPGAKNWRGIVRPGTPLKLLDVNWITSGNYFFVYAKVKS